MCLPVQEWMKLVLMDSCLCVFMPLEWDVDARPPLKPIAVGPEIDGHSDSIFFFFFEDKLLSHFVVKLGVICSAISVYAW